MNEPKFIATYARVSTGRQEEEQTIQIQVEQLRNYAKENGLTIVKEYLDDGWSGAMLERPGLDSLRQDGKKKLFEGVLVYDQDRLSRKYAHQEIIIDELHSSGVKVLFMTIQYPKNPEEKILHGVRGLFAEYEREKIKERFRLGKLHHVRLGHVITSNPPYGYRRIMRQDKTPGYFEINQEEATAYKQIGDWVLEGFSLRAIAGKLHQAGIPPRGGSEGVWNNATISRLLNNPTYIGKAPWRTTERVVPKKPRKSSVYKRTIKSGVIKRPVEEWMEIAVPAIQTQEKFELIRNKLKSNRKFSTRNAIREYLLSGKIHCICGKNMHGLSKDRWQYYRCNDVYTCKPLPRTCKQPYSKVEIIDKLVWDTLKTLIISPELLRQQLDLWLKRRQLKTPEKQLPELEIQLVKLESQKSKYYELYANGIISMGKLEVYLNPLKRKAIAIESEIQAVQNISDELRNKIPDFKDLSFLSKIAKAALNSIDYNTRKKLVMLTIDKIVIGSDMIDIRGFIPLDGVLCLCSGHVDSTNDHRELSTKSLPFSLKLDIKQM